jgi:hypothetical protein
MSWEKKQINEQQMKLNKNASEKKSMVVWNATETSTNNEKMMSKEKKKSMNDIPYFWVR